MIDTPNTKYQFRKCGTNSGEKCSNQDLRYDLDSLMHYTNGAFAKQDGLNTIEVKGNPGHRIAHSSRKNTFSDLDLKGILKMYDCNDKEPGNIFIFQANSKIMFLQGKLESSNTSTIKTFLGSRK